jgi:ribosome biogenesis protein Tsr3
MPAALNSIQLEILKMFRNNQSEEELQEIKSLLINYLSNKAVAEADKAFVEKGYTPEVFESWENEHFRKSK